MYYSRSAPADASLRAFVDLLVDRLESDPNLMASVVTNPKYATLPLDEMAGMAQNR